MAERDFFYAEDIAEFSGPGPKGNYLPYYAARKELWQYSLSLIEDPTRSWCEFGVGEGETLDWFASRKPRTNRLYAFDSFKGIPEPWAIFPTGHWSTQVYVSNRPDVVVVPGLFQDSLTPELIQEIGPLGLLHIDCDLYSSTKTVFDRVGHLIEEGTVIIFDELHNYSGWKTQEIKAFLEFVLANQIQFEYLGRTPSCQASVRVTGRGSKASWTVRHCTWAPTSQGVSVRLPSPSGPLAEVFRRFHRSVIDFVKGMGRIARDYLKKRNRLDLGSAELRSRRLAKRICGGVFLTALLFAFGLRVWSEVETRGSSITLVGGVAFCALTWLCGAALATGWLIARLSDPGPVGRRRWLYGAGWVMLMLPLSVLLSPLTAVICFKMPISPPDGVNDAPDPTSDLYGPYTFRPVGRRSSWPLLVPILTGGPWLVFRDGVLLFIEQAPLRNGYVTFLRTAAFRAEMVYVFPLEAKVRGDRDPLAG